MKDVKQHAFPVPDWRQEWRADGPYERVGPPDGPGSELQHEQLHPHREQGHRLQPAR